MRVPSAIFAVVIAISLFGCSGGSSENEAPIIRTGSEFDAELARVQQLSQGPLSRVDRGEELTEFEKADLRKALLIFDGLVGFRPNAPGLHLGRGKILQVFNSHEDAIKAFDEGASYMVEIKDEASSRTLAEFYYQASRSYEALFNYPAVLEMSGKALEIMPDNPDFLAISASGHIQLKELETAKSELKKALDLSPTHKRATQLMNLIKSAETSPQQPK